MTDIGVIEVNSDGAHDICNGEFLHQPGENPGDAPMPILGPFERDGIELGNEVLIAFDWSGNHCGKEQDEGQVVFRAAWLNSTFVSVGGVMNEFEGEERDA